MKRSIIYILISFALAIVLFTYLFKGEPKFKNDQQRLEYFIESADYSAAENIYVQFIDANPDSIELYYKMMVNHFKMHPVFRNDEALFDYLLVKAEEGSLKQQDIATYSMGLMFSMLDSDERAMEFFDMVEDRNLKYLNNSIGYIQMVSGEIEAAEKSFLKEIENDGNMQGAYNNIAYMFFQEDDMESLLGYLEDAQARKYFPFEVKRYLYLTDFQVLKYLWTVIVNNYQNIGLISFVGALLVMLFYLIYLRKIDIYEPEKWKYLLMIFFLGVLFSELTFLLSDYLNIFTGFDLNGDIWNDLLYCIVGIGMIEELVKIIPLLLILRFTDEVNEPIDYILYASISALGFAFAENLLYFDNYGAHIIFGRTLTAVVFHMFLSSLVAYGIVIGKYKSRKNLRLYFISFFFIAAIVHGLYDFWLINEKVRFFSIISIILFVGCLMVFNTLINNSLNNSNFYDDEIRLNNRKLKKYLVYSLSGILLFQYFIISLKDGSALGMLSLKQSLLSGGYLIFFVTFNLGTYKIMRGVWKPFNIKFPSLKRFKIDYDAVLDSKVSLRPFSRSAYIDGFLPNTGVIEKRESFSDEKDWYFIKLNVHVADSDFNNDYVLVRPRYRKRPIVNECKVIVALYLIPNKKLITADKKSRADFVFRGWAVLENLPLEIEKEEPTPSM